VGVGDFEFKFWEGEMNKSAIKNNPNPISIQV
jgi:hypothetical protein